MAKNNDSIGKTLLVIILVCLVCSVIVAGSAVGLKSTQQDQKLLDKQRNILSVSGLLEPKMSSNEIKALFDQRIESRLIDLKTGEFVSGDKGTFDLVSAAKDPQQSSALPASEDIAGIRRVPNKMEIYLIRDEQKQVNQIVLPVYGNGLWSMMYAFVAIDTDGSTVKGLTYYDQGETPGLGGEIENPNWRKQWVGKQLLDDKGNPAIRLVKGGARSGDVHGVDGLSGATLTANGVQHSFNFWLGDNGYGPFLKKVREGALNNG